MNKLNNRQTKRRTKRQTASQRSGKNQIPDARRPGESINLSNESERSQWAKFLPSIEIGKQGNTTLLFHLSDEDYMTVKQLAELTGESCNKTAARLVLIALYNKHPQIKHLEWQRDYLVDITSRLEQIKTDNHATQSAVAAMHRNQTASYSRINLMLDELYATLFLVLNLVRLTLSYLFARIANLDEPNQQILDKLSLHTRSCVKHSAKELKQAQTFISEMEHTPAETRITYLEKKLEE
jgi:hypothetical protein